MALGLWHSGYGTRAMALGLWHSGYGTRAMALGLWHSGSWALGLLGTQALGHTCSWALGLLGTWALDLGALVTCHMGSWTLGPALVLSALGLLALF
jgi:hypothetical protein